MVKNQVLGKRKKVEKRCALATVGINEQKWAAAWSRGESKTKFQKYYSKIIE